MFIAIFVSAVVVRGGQHTTRGGYFVYEVTQDLTLHKQYAGQPLDVTSTLLGFYPTAYNHSLDTLPAEYRHAHLLSSFTVSAGEYGRMLAEQRERDRDVERARKGEQLAYPKTHEAVWPPGRD